MLWKSPGKTWICHPLLLIGPHASCCRSSAMWPEQAWVIKSLLALNLTHTPRWDRLACFWRYRFAQNWLIRLRVRCSPICLCLKLPKDAHWRYFSLKSTLPRCQVWSLHLFLPLVLRSREHSKALVQFAFCRPILSSFASRAWLQIWLDWFWKLISLACWWRSLSWLWHQSRLWLSRADAGSFL